MSWHKDLEAPPDLTDRLSQLVELDRPPLVSPRRPMDDVLEAPEGESLEVEAPLRNLEMHVGRMYVLAGSHEGPRFTDAIWLGPNRRTDG